MQLKETLKLSATAANNRRKLRYYHESGTDPDSKPRLPLMGYCVENTRELSWELAQRQIPHHIVRGAIAFDAVINCPHWLLTDERTLPDKYEQAIDEVLPDTAADTGRVPPELWDQIPAPETSSELPDEASHYWIEVDASETPFQADGLYTVEAAAEAREYYGEPVVYDGRPDEYYIQLEDSYSSVWDRMEWGWNPHNPQPY